MRTVAVKLVRMHTDIVEIRRANMRRLLEDRFNSSPTALARFLGLSNGAFIVQMCGKHPTRAVTEKTVRKWEALLELPTGWFDRPSVADAVAGDALNPDLLRGVVSALVDACNSQAVTLSPAKFADAVLMLYSEGAVPTAVKLQQLVRLIAS